MKQLQTQRAVHIATAGVSLIALVAFIISYSSLQLTASMYGFPGWQSYLWPLLIDLPILVFAFTSLVIGWLTGERSWFASSMIVLFSVATVVFNLAHSEPAWLNYAVAVMPPLALIVSFEALRELIQIVASHAPAPMTHEAAPAEIAAPRARVKVAAPKPKPMPHEADKIPGHDAAPAQATAEPEIVAPAHVAAEPIDAEEAEGITDEAEGIEQLPSLDKSASEKAKLWDDLKTDEARWTYYEEKKAMKLSDEAIATALGVHRTTITRLKTDFANGLIKVRATNSNGNGVNHG